MKTMSQDRAPRCPKGHPLVWKGQECYLCKQVQAEAMTSTTSTSAPDQRGRGPSVTTQTSRKGKGIEQRSYFDPGHGDEKKGDTDNVYQIINDLISICLYPPYLDEFWKGSIIGVSKPAPRFSIHDLENLAWTLTWALDVLQAYDGNKAAAHYRNKIPDRIRVGQTWKNHWRNLDERAAERWVGALKKLYGEKAISEVMKDHANQIEKGPKEGLKRAQKGPFSRTKTTL